MPNTHLDVILDHAIKTYPNEACGLLAGDGRYVTLAVPVPNVDDVDPTSRFHMHPQEQLSAWRAIQARGLTVMGLYHSHPKTTRLQPSSYDLMVCGDMLSVIVAISPLPPESRDIYEHARMVAHPEWDLSWCAWKADHPQADPFSAPWSR